MIKSNRKVWSIIEKNDLSNVQVLTNINTFHSSVKVIFQSSKEYKVFVRQFENKYGIGTGKLILERLEIIWEK